MPILDVATDMGTLEMATQQSRSEAATQLGKVADQFDGDGDVTLELGGMTVVMTPPEPVMFTLEGESNWSEGDTDATQRIEFELVRWCRAQTADDAALDIRE